MDRKTKKELKEEIGKYIELGNGRFKDEEIETLHDLVSNREEYDGKTKTIKNDFIDRSSDGKYYREEETTFTIKGEEESIYIEENYQYHDDDGQRGGYNKNHNTARDILRLLKILLR